MSYLQRRRFLWILFLIGLALVAVAARATTLVRLRFPELVRYSSAIGRVHCVGAEVHYDKGEIWTDTGFEVSEREKGYLPAYIVVRQPSGKLNQFLFEQHERLGREQPCATYSEGLEHLALPFSTDFGVSCAFTATRSTKSCPTFAYPQTSLEAWPGRCVPINWPAQEVSLLAGAPRSAPCRSPSSPKINRLQGGSMKSNRRFSNPFRHGPALVEPL